MKTDPFHINDIFTISSDQEFNDKAIQIFHHQTKHCKPYKTFLDLINIDTKKVKKVEDVPFLPIELFKQYEIYTGTERPSLIFESSGTTGTNRSKHYVKSPDLYHRSFVTGFEHFYGDIEDYVILGLLPSYIEQGNSSLVYMVDKLVKLSGKPESGFYLNNYKDLRDTLQHCIQHNKSTVLIGVTYALLEFASEYPTDLHNVIVIETGGMKGRKKELIRQEVHDQLKSAFSLNQIHSEYSMTELLSQAYSKSSGTFLCPPWMKVSFRSSADPVHSNAGLEAGIINIIDLANFNSCSFIATQDVGKKDGDGFKVLGRSDLSEIRGCSQLVI